ncbi:MAG: hypothetical protein LOX97_07580 [Sphingomonas sp.]|nr:hypothetical protein [Sphingomonas sp.]
MSSRPLPDRWTEDASWLAQAIDPRAGLIRLVRMDEAAYRGASFLDDRMLGAGLEARLASLAEAMAEASQIGRDDARWIFHIGHVGSTLIARLLGELDNVISIREPRSLRDLIYVPPEERADVAARLGRMMSRTFQPGQFALVKATSFVSELAPLLAPRAPALFLYASPRNYIAGILAGENSVKELAALHQLRSERLHGRGIELVGYDGSNAHRAAAAWACEMTSLESAFDAVSGANILWADFDAMLDDMVGWLGRCARHFGFAAPAEQVREVVAGPLMRRYSKALEYDYSPSLRAELLDEAATLHRAEIADALNMLRRDAGRVPILARALERAEREG